MNIKNLILFSTINAGLVLTSSLTHGGYTVFGESPVSLEGEQKFVRPITAPYFHEDSFITTDVRAWYVNHQFYDDTIGGEAEVYAIQLRVALTDRLQFVAYKDGYTDISDTALGSPSGWNDIAAGLKWAFIQDDVNQFYAAAGVGYELALGDDEVLQDADEFRLWVSANKGFGKLHLGGTVNYRIAGDHANGLLGSSDILSAHLHADYYINAAFSAVVEFNGYWVIDQGIGAALPFSGVDAVSVAGGEDEDVITGALGLEWRPVGDSIGIRAAYEKELTQSVGLFGHRWTLSTVFEF